jgi:hypothetical protein
VNGQQTHTCQVTPMSPDRIGVRQYEIGARHLRQEGILRDFTVKGLRLSTTPVQDFLQRCQTLIDANQYQP